jgi:hypothetical protein
MAFSHNPDHVGFRAPRLPALLFAMLMVAGFAAPIACSSSSSSGGFSCDGKSKCANDPTGDANACKKGLADTKCGTLFVALGECLANAPCGTDGKTDTSKCVAESVAWLTCTTSGDAGSDAAPDLGPDASDAVSDSVTEAASDVASDAPSDAAADLGTDAPDAPATDAAKDVSPDVPPA